MLQFKQFLFKLLKNKKYADYFIWLFMLTHIPRERK